MAEPHAGVFTFVFIFAFALLAPRIRQSKKILLAVHATAGAYRYGHSVDSKKMHQGKPAAFAIQALEEYDPSHQSSSRQKEETTSR